MDKVRERRMGLAGHCVRHLELMASPLISVGADPAHSQEQRSHHLRGHTVYGGASNTTELWTLTLDRLEWRPGVSE